MIDIRLDFFFSPGQGDGGPSCIIRIPRVRLETACIPQRLPTRVEWKGCDRLRQAKGSGIPEMFQTRECRLARRCAAAWPPAGRTSAPSIRGWGQVFQEGPVTTLRPGSGSTTSWSFLRCLGQSCDGSCSSLTEARRVLHYRLSCLQMAYPRLESISIDMLVTQPASIKIMSGESDMLISRPPTSGFPIGYRATSLGAQASACFLAASGQASSSSQRRCMEGSQVPRNSSGFRPKVLGGRCAMSSSTASGQGTMAEELRKRVLCVSFSFPSSSSFHDRRRRVASGATSPLLISAVLGGACPETRVTRAAT